MDVTESENMETAERPANSLGMRHVIVFLLFLSTTASYATRVSMSVGIVAMTTHNDYGYPVFDWDRSIQDTILSSFFWGYIVLQIPAGMLTRRFGGKLFITVALVGNGLINIITPFAAIHGGWMAMCACRVLMGLTQGPLYPSFHGLLGQWAPRTERSRMGTFVYSGGQLGTIIEMMMAGILSAGPWGWPSVYYVVGVTCLILGIMWVIIGASSPTTCKWISKAEKKYIETNAGSANTAVQKKMKTPWKSIWTSLPFWSILIAHAGQSLGFWTLLTEIPSYMNKVLGVDIKKNGLLSSLPYVAMFILSLTFSWTADFLINRNIASVVTVRKICNTIAFWGPAAALLGLSYIPAGHLTLTVIILTITVGLNGGQYVGFLISHIDISPNFASTLMGITNSVSNVFSIVAPLSVSLVVKDESIASEWRKVFFISIAFYFLSNLFFILFISGKVQDWNEPVANVNLDKGVKRQEGMNSNDKAVENNQEKFC